MCARMLFSGIHHFIYSTAFWTMLSCFKYYLLMQSATSVCVCVSVCFRLIGSLMRVCRSIELIKKARLSVLIYIDLCCRKGEGLCGQINNNNKLLGYINTESFVICTFINITSNAIYDTFYFHQQQNVDEQHKWDKTFVLSIMCHLGAVALSFNV